MYSEKSMTRANTAIPGLGAPITAVDVTYDGKWVLATTHKYLMVIKTVFKVILYISHPVVARPLISSSRYISIPKPGSTFCTGFGIIHPDEVIADAGKSDNRTRMRRRPTASRAGWVRGRLRRGCCGSNLRTTCSSGGPLWPRASSPGSPRPVSRSAGSWLPAVTTPSSGTSGALPCVSPFLPAISVWPSNLNLYMAGGENRSLKKLPQL